MKLCLDSEIYKWLISLNILSKSTKYNILTNGKYEMDDITTKKFENGKIFSELIKVLSPTESKTNLKQLENLKESNTAASRLYNWNILYENLKKIGVNLDQDIKALLVSGDIQIINELMKDVYDSISNKLERMSVASSLKSNINYDLRLGRNDGIVKMNKDFGMNKEDPNSINVNKIDQNKNIEDCNSLLELLLIGLSKNLNLKPKQVVALLSNGNKYLAHVLVKGVKGDFNPLINWLQEIYLSTNHIVSILLAEELLIPVLLQILKPTLLSKNDDIVSWGTRIISKLCFHFVENDLLSQAWEWFCKENGGLNSCILCLKRNFNMKDNILSIIIQICKFNTVEMFTIELRKIFLVEKEFLEFIHLILNNLIESSILKDQSIKAGILDYWIDLSYKCFSNEDINSRIISISFLTDFWILNPAFVEDNSEISDNILSFLKKSTRDPNKNIVYSSIVFLFKILDSFAFNKNSFAPIIYKTLTFSCIENYSDWNLRNLFFKNFEEIFEKYATIPIQILMEPLIKQMQVSEKNYILNIFDFEFFEKCCKHPKMQIKLAILFFDLFLKIYLNTFIYYKLVKKLMIILMTRFLESNPFFEYLQKTQEILISLYLSNEKKRKIPFKLNPEFKETEAEIFSSQQRSLIILIIKEIINLNNNQLISQLKELLIEAYNQIKEIRGNENKGIMELLNLCGIDKIEYEKQQEEEIIEIDNNEEEYKLESSSKFIEFEPESSKIKSSLIKIENSEQNSNLDQMFEKDQLLFIEKHGLGLKEKKNKKEKKLYRPNSKVLEDLEKIRIKKMNEKLQKQIDEDEQKLKLELKKKNLHKQIKKRNVALGIANNSNELVTNFTSINQNTKDIYLIDFYFEEDRDLDTVSLVLSKEKYFLKFLFSKYSNSTHSKKNELFGDLKEKFDKIGLNDLIKFLKDVNLINLINREEIQHLIKLINVKYQGSDNVNALDFDGFCKFLIQLSLNRFIIKDIDMNNKPAGYILKEMIDYCKNSMIQRNEFKNEEDKYRNELNELNKKLIENEDFELPEKFKKVHEKLIDFDYSFPKSLVLELPLSYKISYEIINELLIKKFKINLIEPKTLYTFVPKAKLKTETQKNIKIKTRGFSEEPSISFKSETIIKSGNVNMIKKLRSKQEIIEKLSPIKIKRDNSPSVSTSILPIKNKLFEEKLLEKEKEEFINKEKELKRKQRQEELEKKLNEMKEKKKEEEINKLIEERKKKEDKDEEEKKEFEKNKKRLEKNKEKLKEFKLKQETEKEKLDREEKENKLKKQEEKKKEIDEFLKKQTEKLKKDFDVKKQERELSLQKQQKEEILIKEKENKRKEKVSITLEKEREKRQNEKESRKKISNLYNAESFKSLFKSYEEKLTTLYNFYVTNTELKLDVNYSRENLQFKGFMNFASHFKLYPEILNSESLQLIYRSITKDKKIIDNIPIGITYEEFLLSLIRISIKGKSIFDKIFLKGKNSNNNDIINNKNQEEQKNIEEINIDKNKIDEYINIDNTDEKTLEGLFFYLNIPEEKSKINNKIRDLINENSKVLALRDRKKNVNSKINDNDKEKIESIDKKITSNKEISVDKKKDKKNSNKENFKIIKEKEKKFESKSPGKEINKESSQKDKSLKIINPNGISEKWKLKKN